jgi:hypothetical protein
MNHVLPVGASRSTRNMQVTPLREEHPRPQQAARSFFGLKNPKERRKTMRRETGTRTFATLAAGGFLLLLPGVSSGFDADRMQELQGTRQRIAAACGDSLESLCAGEQGPAQVHCLMDHYENISSECQTLLDEVEQRRQEEREARRVALAAACGDSLESLCAGKDGPAVVGCLIQHYEETSTECQALLDQIQAMGKPGRGPGPH